MWIRCGVARLRTAKLLSASSAAVVSATSAALEFQPVESAVVVALSGRAMAFCARVDLAHAEQAAGDLLVALSASDSDGVQLVAYSQRPEWAAGVLHSLATGQLDGVVIAQHVTDDTTAWRCEGGELLAPEPFTPVTDMTSRDDLVAEVSARRQPIPCAIAGGRITRYGQMECAAVLAAALEGVYSPEQAAEASAILARPEHLHDTLDAIVMAPDAAYKALCKMRRWCADEHLPETLAALTVAAWASHHGPAATEVLNELGTVAPGSPMLGMLSTLVCTSPSEWRANYYANTLAPDAR